MGSAIHLLYILDYFLQTGKLAALMAAVISSKVHLSAVSIRSSSTPRPHVLQDYLLQAGCSPGLSSLYIRKCGILGDNENVVPPYHYCSHVFYLCIPYFVSLSFGVDVF